MQINPNLSAGGASPVGPRPAAPKPHAAASEAAAFGDTAALNKALKAAPAVRPDQVARAKELIANPNYPPPEGIKKIAQLLALSLTADSQ